jgi:LysM repeat protein
VRSGDTLGTIAGRFGTTVDELLALNPGIDPRALHVGQSLRVH